MLQNAAPHDADAASGSHKTAATKAFAMVLPWVVWNRLQPTQESCGGPRGGKGTGAAADNGAGAARAIRVAGDASGTARTGASVTAACWKGDAHDSPWHEQISWLPP